VKLRRWGWLPLEKTTFFLSRVSNPMAMIKSNLRDQIYFLKFGQKRCGFIAQ
jgi:hypothetical protein